MTKGQTKFSSKVKTRWALMIFVTIWTAMCIVIISVLAWGLIGCTQDDGGQMELNEKVVYSEQSNWLVNLDSLETIDNYILTYRKLRRHGISEIKPYILTENGKKISLRKLRPVTGRGYFWDCRAHISITINSDGSYFSSWNSGNKCIQGELIEHNKDLKSLEDLRNEILLFYKTNSQLELRQKPDKSDLEIWITPRDDKLLLCQSTIEAAAFAYQAFHRQSDKKEIPFLAIISPKLDQNRMKRIIDIENDITKPKLN